MAIGSIVQRSVQQLSASWRTRFLLALALHHRGVLVTLDKRLTAAAVPGRNAAIELIQPSR